MTQQTQHKYKAGDRVNWRRPLRWRFLLNGYMLGKSILTPATVVSVGKKTVTIKTENYTHRVKPSALEPLTEEGESAPCQQH